MDELYLALYKKLSYSFNNFPFTYVFVASSEEPLFNNSGF